MIQRVCRDMATVVPGVVLALQLAACGIESDNHGLVSSDVTASAVAVITGSVGDGPIAGATLSIYDRDGKLVQTELSDNSAKYSAHINVRAFAYPLTIVVTGGTDLVTGRAPDFRLTSVVTQPGAKSVNINPFTTLIVESARLMPGGLSEDNVSAARQHVVQQLNFGLDPVLVADPIGTAITNDNVAVMVKASEALGEMIRRSADRLAAAGLTVEPDHVVAALSADLVDGVVDGSGGAGADSRVAALASLTSAQVLIESLSNTLKVDGSVATASLDASIRNTHPSVADNALTDSVRVNAEMLDQAGTAVAAAQALAPSLALTSIASVLAGVPANSLAASVEAILPGDTSIDLDPAIMLAASVPDQALAVVNDVVRRGGGSVANVSENGASQTSGTPESSVPVTDTPESSASQISGTPESSVPVANAPENAAPRISGTPETTVVAGSGYSFQPVAGDPDGDNLTFTVQNRPAWASFNSNTGRLLGTPGASDVGSYGNIRITVSDGTVSTALAPFSVTVKSSAPETGSVSLSWAPPTSRSDGTALALSEIAGYTLYYGSSEGNYPASIVIDDPFATSMMLIDLPVGTYYFVMTTRDTRGGESGYSSAAQRQVQ